MSGTCDECNEHPVDCECGDNKRWYSFEELPPEEGQLCLVKMVTTVQAYYLPDCKVAQWITPDKEQVAKQVATAWKPVRGAKKHKGFNKPNAENPYEDID